MEPEQQHQAASSDLDDSGVMRLFSRSGVVSHIAKDHPDLLAESNTLAAVRYATLSHTHRRPS